MSSLRQSFTSFGIVTRRSNRSELHHSIPESETDIADVYVVHKRFTPDVDARVEGVERTPDGHLLEQDATTPAQAISRHFNETPTSPNTKTRNWSQI
jgi:hypothetical protein